MDVFRLAVSSALKLYCKQDEDEVDRDEWARNYMPAIMEEIQAGTEGGPPIEEACKDYNTALLQMLALTLQWCYLNMPDDDFFAILTHIVPKDSMKELLHIMVEKL